MSKEFKWNRNSFIIEILVICHLRSNSNSNLMLELSRESLATFSPFDIGCDPPSPCILSINLFLEDWM